jgi:hypothetical protein
LRHDCFLLQYEILNNLQKAQKSLHIETVPPLKLSPPAIYHEKIQKRTILAGEASKHSARSQKPQKMWQMKEQKSKQTGSQLPQKPIVLREFRLHFIDFISFHGVLLIQSWVLFMFLNLVQVLRKANCRSVKTMVSSPTILSLYSSLSLSKEGGITSGIET